MASSRLTPRIEPGVGKGKEMGGIAPRRKMPILSSEISSLRQGGNEPFGSRPEPWIQTVGLVGRDFHGEAPKGRARVQVEARCSCA
jgi:hypothetical protein